MRSKLNIWIFLLGGLVVLLSSTALLINSFIYKFLGNNYFPPNTIQIALSLLLFYFGLILQVGKDKHLTKIARELIYFFLIMCIIALSTNAIQLTPFPPIDQQIVAFEHYFNIDIPAILTWTHNHPKLHLILGFTYDSLTNQMCVLPLFLIAMGRFQLIREYYFLLLFSTLFGFGFYYFYPTTAPASVIHSPFFTPYQIATGLKFKEIHNHLPPSTIEGGLIALPSFHCIWALFSIFLVKEWPLVCAILVGGNIILIASCILLGWHYPTDIMAGFLLAGFSYVFLLWCKR
ncbi:phosphatase PAP2 family protein [Legionella sp. km772]|uniref:phosphatase PAP2 family protein n=1 Tax=Legionella sp. km772 TaxID=2498111 RepID=UPI000F8D7C35|nr:phosphatase PAP2 family protein [Legionella sp. km772]RUR13207.1 phosphatase PAP2 family protein [Legionella sp. km772]